ncbi:hypothetical protein KFZ58_14095 [Virgibacillus sp. NKC19-16]|uniref:hypothetical protein n=1 Tax=Virgibacillus salidurans TaxID=2831673 RepID=UPI001F27E713|nr:hypothetical protein [Virgibacillus sp. NKC19-16]UJL45521.1 hypothetical protein KFZ58_14095 [Virgibacillus sp. NKC19-16]
MPNSKNWFRIPLRDGLFLIGLIGYVVAIFLPWSYDIKILNISLLAWGAGLLFLLAPITGIILTLAEKSRRKDN